MRRAIRKQPRLIAARTASDIAGSGAEGRGGESIPFYPFHHLHRQRVKVELHITGDISQVEWSLSPPPSSSPVVAFDREGRKRIASVLLTVGTDGRPGAVLASVRPCLVRPLEDEATKQPVGRW